jgi:16S rRNA (adenine1518-N6/adenine1519-N6)-dimethyltransferase
VSRRPPGRAEIVSLLADHGIAPSRALGQNFVTDPNLVERVARLARVGPGDRVLEIGAGLGSLTVALAATGAEVLAVEIDRYLVPVLRGLVEPLGVKVVEADAMSCDWAELLGGDNAAGGDAPRAGGEALAGDAPGAGGEALDGDAPGAGGEALAGGVDASRVARAGVRPWVLVANLPYNIATPLVADLLAHVPSIGRMLVMIQREVGERLAAAPGSRTYGAVSVRVAYFAEARVLARVPADVFLPRPNVESVLVEILRRPSPAVPTTVATYEEIDRLVRAGFSGRRKMLRRSLAGLVTEEAFAAAGVESTRRPEELGVETWGKLAACQRMQNREEPPAS